MFNTLYTEDNTKREYKIFLISIVVLKYVSNSHREDMLLNTDILLKCFKNQDKEFYDLKMNNCIT